jgi:hypothetical protein
MMQQNATVEMDFKQVIQTCLDFATANNGTIQSCSAGSNPRLGITSRTTRTEIYVEQVKPGVWEAEQTQNAIGDNKKKKNRTRETVYNEQHLKSYLIQYWDIQEEEESPKKITPTPQISIAIVPQLKVESSDTTVTRVADGSTGLARFEVNVTVVLEQQNVL